MLPKSLAIVTGAGSGIGLACARRLAKAQPVLAIGRNRAKLDKLAAEFDGSVLPWPLDVSSRQEVHALRDDLMSNRVSVTALINNAGFARSGSMDLPLEALEDNWDAVIATNLTGAFLMSIAMAPLLARPGGRVINVSSIAAYTGGRNKGSAIYAASKAGLHGLSAGLARELSDEGITVNTIAPGLVAQTDFTGSWPQSRIDEIVGEMPVGRAGCADEIAAMIEFLCSANAGFITGEVINQNGGFRFGG